MKLIKRSFPVWSKLFDSDTEARDELFKNICNPCRCEYNITGISSIDDMLATSCGCEFMIINETIQ